ncbi:MAG TPA: ABC transporter substrate-binding protein [Longimicrobiales bacterium]|nr:ABC transporter substrate-binding protein [Longimicrobiales bacterium]
MGCCEATNPNLIGVQSPRGGTPAWRDDGVTLDRRTAVKGMMAAAGALALTSCGPAEQRGLTQVRLAFCGQLLCVVPYEVTRARGHFEDEGLSVELVYTRGGNAAMQALVGGAVEFAGTSFDVALQAAANGAGIVRFASTGRLPLFALAVAPGRAADLLEVADLAGATVGISGLGNADHALLLYLLDQAGVDPAQVRFAAIGTNLYDALRIGQVDAAMVQEPALSLVVEAGGRELVNFMELEQARAQLGGAYEFMGVSVRAAEREQRRDEMRRLAAALARGLQDTRTIPPDEIIAALPEALLAGSDTAQLREILERYRTSLYAEGVAIDVAAAERVARAHEIADLLEPGEVDLRTLLDTSVLGA